MPKYIGYVAIKHYRSFEFEADDDDLAYDHLETLTYNLNPSTIMNEWEESGPEDIYIEQIDEV